MATSLVQRAKQIISAEVDDFFRAETVTYYINKSQEKVLSYNVLQEKEQGRSLRVLDNLRQKEDITPSSAFTNVNDYFKGELDISGLSNPLYMPLYLEYNNKTVLRELSSQNLFLLKWGNLIPSLYEGYYYIASDSIYDIYLHEDGSSTPFSLYYIQRPTDITDTDDSLPELPSNLENAVLYGTAFMMVTQEGVGDQQQGTSANQIQTIYQEELQSNSF